MARRNRRRKTQEQKQQIRARLVQGALVMPLRLCLLAALGVGIGFGAYQLVRFLRTSPALAVRVIEVRGTQHSRPESLLRAGGIEEGMNIFAVDAPKVERRLEAQPWVRRAHVRRAVPDRIEITVTEFVPAGLVNLDGLYYVTAGGEVFKRVQAGEPVDLPVVTGLTREEFKSDPQRVSRRIADALETVDTLRKADCLQARRVGEVHLDELLGTTVILDPGALSVRLGRQPIPERLPLLCQVLEEVTRQRLPVQAILLDHEGRPGWATLRLRAAEPTATLLSKDRERIGAR